MQFAPIALFAFKRPNHFSKCLQALQRCDGFAESPVFIFVDGARSETEQQEVDRVISLAQGLRHPQKQVFRSERNRGLAASISSEITQILNQFSAVIVVEDDLQLHRSAIMWFNKGLERYADEKQVMQIGGYQYVVPEFSRRTVGTFQRFVTTWGWATWRRAWQFYDADTVGWEGLLDDVDRSRAFNLGNTYPYSTMLRKLHRGEIDSWGIRWYYSVFINQGISLMPPRTLVRNLGFDAMATHNSVGSLKRIVSGRAPAMWNGEGAPDLPLSPEVIEVEENAFRRGLLRTRAMRNDRIKRELARLGFKAFR